MTKNVHELKDEELKEHEAKFGRYNDAPPNLSPCDPADFWYRFMNFMPQLEEYRQMRLDPKKQLQAAKLFYYGADEGLAFLENYNYEEHKMDAPRLFKFYICKHHWVEQPSRFMHLHEFKCDKCGAEYTVDSSG